MRVWLYDLSLGLGRRKRHVPCGLGSVQILEYRTLLAADLGNRAMPYSMSLLQVDRVQELALTGPLQVEMTVRAVLPIDRVASATAIREDRFAILDPVLPSGQFAAANYISSASVAFTVAAADLDLDGDLDLLSASFGDHTIAWYENNGEQVFTRHVITSGATNSSWVVPVDLDRDGDLDVIGSAAGRNSITWYENDGRQQFTSRLITTSESDIVGFVVADVDRDGDTDIVSSSKGNDSVAWYENNGRQEFTKHTITTSADLACAVYAADIDGDGDIDVASASFFDDTIAWYENNGSQVFTKRVISSTADGARGLVIADVDGDGDQDVVSTSFYDNTVAWYQNDGRRGFTRHVISSTVRGAIGIFAADIDGDRDLDILATSRTDNTIAWFENTGSLTFPQHNITTSDSGAHGVIAADVDGDGDLDVASASQFGNRVTWYENLPTPTPLTVSLDSASSAITNRTSIPVTVSLSAPIAEFTLASLIVQNGEISNFLGSGAHYTFDLLAINEGTVTVRLPAGAVTDAAGHRNRAAVLTREFKVPPPGRDAGRGDPHVRSKWIARSNSAWADGVGIARRGRNSCGRDQFCQDGQRPVGCTRRPGIECIRNCDAVVDLGQTDYYRRAA